MKPVQAFLLTILVPLFLFSCKGGDQKKETPKTTALKDTTVTYTVDSLTMNSYVVYDSKQEGKRPAVLVIHEWWGLNDYIRSRARQLAELGYIAMAVDMFGNGRMGNDPTEANNLTMPFYSDPQLAKKIFDAGLERLKTFEQVDPTRIGGIGYCFGGGMMLTLARLGEPLNGVVSFHGILAGAPPEKDLLKAEILVCHGEDDKFVLPAEVEQFKKQMDSIGARYTFKSYPGATHAFTNPGATALGQKFSLPIAYNAAADTASWNEMKLFFERIFR